jgi:hypothetical protein
VGKNFSPLESVQAGSAGNPPSYSIGTEGFIPEGKAVVAEEDK